MEVIMKYIKILFVAIALMFATGCGNKVTTYKQIDYNTYTSLKNAKESYILYLGSSSCSHCQNFKPVLESIIKDYQLDISYIDISTLTEKEYAVVQNDTKLQGTPTIVFIEDGVVKTSPKIVGEVGYNTALNSFKESGYIK